MKKNLVYIVCAFSLILFASCNKPTAKNVPGNWCMTEYRIVESNESSDTTVETSFIDADWQQISYSNDNSAQKNKKKGILNSVPSLNLKSDGTFTRSVKYYYYQQIESNDSVLVFVSEFTRGCWEFIGSGKEIDHLALVIEEELIINNDEVLSVPDTVARNRYAKAEKYVVYNFDKASNKNIVLSLDKSKNISKIESENISLERITSKNEEKFLDKYEVRAVPCSDE